MRLSPSEARPLRSLPTVTALAASLCVGTALLAPTASANPAAAETVVCESTASSTLETPKPGEPDGTRFSGKGTITCNDAQGNPYLEGKSTFSGTLPEPMAGLAAAAVYRGQVDWSDGKVTTGTFTDFGLRAADNGVLEFTVEGVNDAASTRFGGWSASLSGQTVRELPDPTGKMRSTQKGKVTYTS